MENFNELMQILTVPRLNGSKGLRHTQDALCRWLENAGISYQLHTYQIYPYFMEAIGAWMLISQLLLALSIWLRWGWVSLMIALISLFVILLEAGQGKPIIARLKQEESDNIILSFSPPHPTQEIVVSAHYDSKTELLDHRQRGILLKLMPVGAILIILLGILGSIAGFSVNWAYYAGIFLTIPHLLLMLPLGANFAFGRLGKQSLGAIDNGGSCAVVLDIARRLTTQDIKLKHSKVTVALFTGEEIVVQGSRAYVSQRDWTLPTTAINLELVGQNGDYALTTQIGSPAVTLPATPSLNAMLQRIIEEKTGHPPKMWGKVVGTDSLPFLEGEMPATSLMSLDKEQEMGGLHRPTDNMDRVSIIKLAETADIVIALIQQLDQTQSVKSL